MNISSVTDIATRAAMPNASVNSPQGGSGLQGDANIAMSAINTTTQVANILNSDLGAKDKAQYVKETVGLAVADYYTFGLASQFHGFMEKNFPGVVNAFRKFSKNFDPVIQIVGKLFGSKNRWQTEGKKIDKLIADGVRIPEELQGATKLTRGRSKEELIDHSVPRDFVGFKEDGEWVNNRFADSRKTEDLTPRDIWGYAAFFEKFGNEWLEGLTEQQRFSIAEAALEAGAVSEGRGSVTINWTPELEAKVAEIKGQ